MLRPAVLLSPVGSLALLLAGLTGVFHSVTCVGLVFPLLDSLSTTVVTGPAVFLIAAAVAAAGGGE